MSTRNQKKLEENENNNQILAQQQQQIDELKNEIKRLRVETQASSQENDILRREVVRMDELVKQAHQNASNHTKVSCRDVCIQSEVHVVNTMNDADIHRDQASGETLNKGDSVSQVVLDSRYGNTINNKDGPQNDFTSELISGIFNQFQQLQINIPLPVFDLKCTNPVEFIRNLEKYFVRKEIMDSKKLLVVEDALRGSARVWFDTVLNPFRHFNEFKDKFFNKYLYNTCICMILVLESGVYRKATLLPQRVRDILSTVDFADSDRISQALARLDLSSSFVGGINAGNRQITQNNGTDNLVKSRVDEKNSRDRQGQTRQNRPEQTKRYEQRNRQEQNSWYDRQNKQVRTTRMCEDNEIIEEVDGDSWDQDNELESGDNENRTEINELHKEKNWEYERNGSKMSEFAEELVWDVQEGVECEHKYNNTRVVCPQILVRVGDMDHAMLIDSGSEVTCVSEVFYKELQKDNRILELPVTSVSVFGAVGNKPVVFKKQIQLCISVGNLEVMFSFLVIPGLSKKLIAGVDLQSRLGMVIDFKNKQIKVEDYTVPKERMLLFASNGINTIRFCNLIRLKRDLWYECIDIESEEGMK
ncbi:uncharacterized protein LOC122507367 [Leptopilina heterotoma]|uniref:uncharacterized protein LOC122507367 n=1 Tax=Leptopilina heterotoma TaxID=63436 RepID=UPI001CAA3604|nr:uncharacterized protein LOC122507367 [Leptopilina heterotoma]